MLPASNILRRGVVSKIAPSISSRAASTQALSKPTLNNIEKRWEGMPLQEQADLWMALRDRMKGSWKELTVQEQKAGKCRKCLRHLLHRKRHINSITNERRYTQRPRRFLAKIFPTMLSETSLLATYTAHLGPIDYIARSRAKERS